MTSDHSTPISDQTSPHDVAALLKQYLRELPEPLLTNRLYPVFAEVIKNSTLSEDEKQELVVLTCLLLPQQHLLCLKVLMKLLHDVANSCETGSLMDSNSLALVVSPNILPLSSSLSDVQRIADVTRILIEKVDDVCRVPVDMMCNHIAVPQIKPSNSHTTPWKNFVSDKIRGTWSRLRGAGGKGNTCTKCDEEFTSLNKRPALESLDKLQTPLFRSAKQLPKRKPIPVFGKKEKNNTDTTPVQQIHSKARFTDISVCNDPNSGLLDLESTDHNLQLTTIGQRVRKRRHHQREIVHSSSTTFASSELSMNQAKLSISQSDTQLVHSVTPGPSIGDKSRLKALLRKKTSTCEKRKGFVHEPGLDRKYHSARRKDRRNHKREETLCLLETENDHEKCPTYRKNTTERATQKNSKTSHDCATPPSPGLLQKVTSEVAEYYRHTPPQLAPMLSTNDSYLFAVSDSDFSDNGLHVKTTPLPIPTTPGNGLTDINTSFHCNSPSPTKPFTSTTDYGCGHNQRKRRKSGVRTRSSMLTTPAKRSCQFTGNEKLSRRAKQYVVSNSSTNKKQLHRTTPYKTTSSKSKQGVVVYEWIL